MSEKIVILHTNDLHSHLERWPKIRRFLVNQRKSALREGVTTLTFDIGDALDREHALTEASQGQANVALMNQIEYDGVTIGNNEGLGLNHEDLNRLYDDANFPVLLGNITDMQTGEIPLWAHSYEIITTPEGHHIGVIGLTAPFELTYPLMGWTPETAESALRRILGKLAGKTDYNILLSHLGLPTDRYLADHFEDLNLILGAHTHHHLPRGEWRNQTLLAAAGRYGEYIGQIGLELNHGKILGAWAETVATDTLPVLPKDAAEINEYQQQGINYLKKQKVGYLEQPYQRDVKAPRRLIDLGLATLMERTDTDLSMLSTGMFLTDLPAGEIDQEMLHTMLPHAVHAMRTQLSGRDVIRLMQEVQKNRNYLLGGPVHGMGFRGKKWGEIIWSGLTLTADGNVLVHNEPINLTKKYTIGSLDHYSFFPFFPTLEIAGNNQMFYDTVFREDFAQYIRNHFPN